MLSKQRWALVLPMVFSDQEIDHGMAIRDEVFAIMARGRTKSTVAETLSP